MNQFKRILALALSLVFVFACCTSVFAAVVEEVANPTKGDVNKNGEIDMIDYILVKRAYFNTFTLDEEQTIIADINCNDKLDMLDYILLKRIYFGTYAIPSMPEAPSTEDEVLPDEDTSSDDVSSDVPSEDVSSDIPSEDVSSDVPSDEPALGSFDNPYLVNLNELRTVVNIPAGGEAYVKANDSDGNVLTVGYATSADYYAYYCRQQYTPAGEDNATSITMNADVDFVCFTNSSETEDVILYMTLTEGAAQDTTGTMDDPKELELTEQFGALRAFDEAVLGAGNQGYWYTLTAPAEGMLVVQVGAYDDEYNDLGWLYCVNNLTASKYGDNHWSDDDPVVNPEFVAVNAGDEIQIFVTTYDPADMFNAPAGNVSLSISFVEYGSADAPFEAVLGDNTATAKDGSEGIFYTYTAEQDGTLVVTMPEGEWVYVVNNLTSYVYGDTQWSDSDPLVSAFEVEVTAGDEIQIMVNTYDAANPWNAPAGEIVWNLSYKVASDDTSSDDETSEDVSSDDETSDDVSSDDETSDDTYSDDVTSDDTSSDDVTSDDVSSDDETSDDTSSDDVTSDDTSSDDETSDDTSSDDVTVPHVVSVGASYTASTDNYYTIENQALSTNAAVALTDGAKGSPDFWKATHVGYQGLSWSTGVEFTLDLGETYTLSSFTATCAGGVWGIGVPEVGATLAKVSVYDEETASWVDVDATVVGNVSEVTSSWGDTIKIEEIVFTVNGEPVVASQVKFTLSAWGSFLIVEELEAIGY